MTERKQIEQEFSSLSELARRCGKCYRTIHRAVQAGKIKTVRFGGSIMVSKSEAERILQHGWR